MDLIHRYHAPVDHEPSRPDDDADPTETIEISGLARERAGAPGGPYTLMVASGARRGLHWPVDDAVEAGRNPEAAIFLDDVTVSRHHAIFTIEDGRLVVRDLGSTNGTYVNGQRCDEAVLSVGDQVYIGRYHLVVATDQ